LRQSLGDSAENPRLVETLAKRGYRFAARVSGAISQAGASTSQSLEAPEVIAHNRTLGWLQQRREVFAWRFVRRVRSSSPFWPPFIFGNNRPNLTSSGFRFPFQIP